MEYKVKILRIENVAKNIKRFLLEKPSTFSFIPGHSMMVSINLPEWKDKRTSFTMTSANSSLFLEFTIKRYDERNGITKKMHELKEGDELILSDMFGSVRYKGPGVFIAAGMGINPFIAIFRQLKEDNKLEGNKLIYSNKTKEDVIYEEELKNYLRDNVIITLTRDKFPGYLSERINADFLKRYIKDFNQNFYVCGPDKFVSEVKSCISELKREAQRPKL